MTEGMTMVWYHGTKPESVESIRREGFRVGTWFARAEADARYFGGPCVFAVALDPGKVGPGVDWQMHTLEPVPASAIVGFHGGRPG